MNGLMDNYLIDRKGLYKGDKILCCTAGCQNQNYLHSPPIHCLKPFETHSIFSPLSAK